MELNTINKTGTWSETADRINSNFSKISIEVEEIKQNGGGGSGGGGDVTNADHATSAYTLDKNTPVLDWFLSALNDDDAQGIINFLKGLKISGNLVSRIVKQGDKDVTYTDEDVMSALRVMIEIENSVEKMKEIFLRKDVADSTKYLLSLLGGVLINKYAKFGDFVTGVSGGYIDEKGDMEMGSGVFRKRLFVPEIAYNRTTYFKGRMVNSPGGGCSVLSYVDNGDGTYTITPDLTDADGLSQFVDDILTTYFVTKNSEGKLNGFEEMKFRVTAADYTAKKFTVIPRPGHSDWKPADWEVNEDWDMLLDGRELKGESITFLGEFATAPANPKNGDSYRNTTDRATYIYQDGRWQLMISDGKDGKGYEYIYTRGNIIDNTPEKPDSQQKDGYVPEGWTDNYLGTDIDHQVEWGCTRFKENGVWSEFSDPAVVHRWSKDGENAIMADFDNEMVNAALTSDGKVVSSQTWNTTVSMWYGTEKLTLDSITCTPDTNLLCATDKNTGVVTISVSAGATLAATNTVKITIRATKNGQQYSRDLSFTVAGVRGGADGSDAVLYSIIVSATSVSKDKNGNYSVSSVSCYRQKSVGGVISTTTDGTLKYSIDGGTETTINNNTAISSGNFTKTLKFIFYVNDQIVDVETVPMLSDGKDGADGESITAAGHWESANTPYAKNSTVSFAGGSYLSKVQTSNPPLPLLRVRGGRYLRKKDGGYILAGKRSDKAVNSDWQEMTSGVEPSASYWLDSPVSTINFTSTGTPSPSAFVVTMKQNVGGNVSDTNRFYLVARKYNGSWLAHVGATLSNQISVPATAGYTQFAVRAYQSASDANAWNNNFIAEKGVGVANDGAIGATGATGASPRDMGVFQSGTSYVWNASYRDKIIYKFNGVYYNFLVRNYGASVTAAPTSVNGDSNWEAMQKFVNIATDTLFATGANICGFMFTYKGMDANGIPFGDIKSQKSTNGVPNLILNSESGYIHGINMDIEGGRIGPFSIASGMLSSKILYENETNKYVGFNLSAGQIEFYNERTFANVRIGGNTQFVTIEGIKYDAGIDIQSPNAMIGMHIKTPSIPLFVEGGNIFLHPNNDSYVSIRGIVGNWRNISVKASLNNNDDNVMFINRDNIEVTLPPDVPGHTIYFKRMSGGVRLTGGRILPAPGGQEVSYIDLDFASGFIKCMGNYWVMFYCG